jgi:hypothetical protein
MSARAPSSTTVASIRAAADRVITLAENAPDPCRTVVTAGRTLPQVLVHLIDVVARCTPDSPAEAARAGPHAPPLIDLTEPGDRTAPIGRGESAGRGEPTRRESTDQGGSGRGGRPVVLPTRPATGPPDLDSPRERTLPEAAAALRAAVQRLPGGPPLDDAGPVPYTGGVEVVPADLYGLILGEFVAVGHDVAASLHRHWRIDPDDAALVIRAVCSVLPAWVDADRAGRACGELEVRVRGDGRYRWRFADGAVTVDPPEPLRRPDVIISGRPAALVLLVYGRLPLWQGLVTGRVLTWGRHPRLAMAATGCLRAP